MLINIYFIIMKYQYSFHYKVIISLCQVSLCIRKKACYRSLRMFFSSVVIFIWSLIFESEKRKLAPNSKADNWRLPECHQCGMSELPPALSIYLVNHVHTSISSLDRTSEPGKYGKSTLLIECTYQVHRVRLEDPK